MKTPPIQINASISKPVQEPENGCSILSPILFIFDLIWTIITAPFVYLYSCFCAVEEPALEEVEPKKVSFSIPEPEDEEPPEIVAEWKPVNQKTMSKVKEKYKGFSNGLWKGEIPYKDSFAALRAVRDLGYIGVNEEKSAFVVKKKKGKGLVSSNIPTLIPILIERAIVDIDAVRVEGTGYSNIHSLYLEVHAILDHLESAGQDMSRFRADLAMVSEDASASYVKTLRGKRDVQQASRVLAEILHTETAYFFGRVLSELHPSSECDRELVEGGRRSAEKVLRDLLEDVGPYLKQQYTIEELFKAIGAENEDSLLKSARGEPFERFMTKNVHDKMPQDLFQVACGSEVEAARALMGVYAKHIDEHIGAMIQGSIYYSKAINSNRWPKRMRVKLKKDERSELQGRFGTFFQRATKYGLLLPQLARAAQDRQIETQCWKILVALESINVVVG